MKEKVFYLLTLKDRQRIEKWRFSGTSPGEIALRLGFDKSTIYRELKRGLNSQRVYQAEYAHKKSASSVRHRKLGKRKILLYKRLNAFVHEKLGSSWSPTQIANNLKDTYPNDKTMHISNEAVYQYIYVLPRGTLKQTLIKGLRRGHKYRYTQRQKAQDEEMRGKIAGMLSIHERPEEVADRTIPGHWEGDLIIGKYKRSAIATLVERTTRYTLLIPLLQGKDAESVRIAMVKRLSCLPESLIKSLTYDQGKEMSQHTQFTVDTGMQVYFADPASPWQRGTNENTNGLIRQFFPKGTDFSLVSEKELRRVEDLLNGRPRKCIGFKFPKEVFYNLVALNS
jgi:IS30 family transposase